MTKTRSSYTNQRKLAAVKYTETHENSSAAVFFEINEKQIRNWRKDKALLELLNPRRCNRR
jgi:predicted GIY-YIG superfamily endonuclease